MPILAGCSAMPTTSRPRATHIWTMSICSTLRSRSAIRFKAYWLDNHRAADRQQISDSGTKLPISAGCRNLLQVKQRSRRFRRLQAVMMHSCSGHERPPTLAGLPKPDVVKPAPKLALAPLGSGSEQHVHPDRPVQRLAISSDRRDAVDCGRTVLGRGGGAGRVGVGRRAGHQLA